ncbi:hypothetical protein DKK47_RS09720 [Enterococcus faecium]|uniref:hypothetical protein n=1 Tax=Enterococcus TaxID=1350 RepID=UPI00111E2589|nr:MULTISPECIES: hypothetical protein [Enterococcus]EGP5553311.1 hypothetical protein [Enterococcus faecium]EGP5585038.1 hypothetical protein [Enterococcus faecium]EGP5735358.1 hypothetical protein [Enterococcus faecium]EME3569349.1 hypothetical protein [Enterococcus faecium]EME7156241.1 hypothetical protein [Enterococcus faecium]
MGKMKKILVPMLILLFFGTSQISEAAGYLVYEVSFPLGTYTSSNDSSKEEETKNAGASQSTTEGSDKKENYSSSASEEISANHSTESPHCIEESSFSEMIVDSTVSSSDQKNE